jgi:hypothetical protein
MTNSWMLSYQGRPSKFFNIGFRFVMRGYERAMDSDHCDYDYK